MYAVVVDEGHRVATSPCCSALNHRSGDFAMGLIVFVVSVVASAAQILMDASRRASLFDDWSTVEYIIRRQLLSHLLIVDHTPHRLTSFSQ